MYTVNNKNELNLKLVPDFLYGNNLLNDYFYQCCIFGYKTENYNRNISQQE